MEVFLNVDSQGRVVGIYAASRDADQPFQIWIAGTWVACVRDCVVKNLRSDARAGKFRKSDSFELPEAVDIVLYAATNRPDVGIYALEATRYVVAKVRVIDGHAVASNVEYHAFLGQRAAENSFRGATAGLVHQVLPFDLHAHVHAVDQQHAALVAQKHEEIERSRAELLATPTLHLDNQTFAKRMRLKRGGSNAGS